MLGLRRERFPLSILRFICFVLKNLHGLIIFYIKIFIQCGALSDLLVFRVSSQATAEMHTPREERKTHAPREVCTFQL